MVSYYYFLNCGRTIWIFGLTDDTNLEYDALSHLIAGIAAAVLGLVQARLLCRAVAPLRLSESPILTFWLSEGLIPRICVWLRPAVKGV